MIRVGGLRVRTDSSGRYSSWSATPYERIQVELDTLSLDDPSWVPAVPAHFLRPSPHQFTGVAFPLVHTREVLGRLTPDSGMAMPAGVSLELRDSTTGALYRTRTFGDGGFYISRMRPGRYRLTVSASSLAVLQAASPEVSVIVPMDGEEAIEVPPIVLRRPAPGG
jgi:outer membrane usher protein FimD/PapC